MLPAIFPGQVAGGCCKGLCQASLPKLLYVNALKRGIFLFSGSHPGPVTELWLTSSILNSCRGPARLGFAHSAPSAKPFPHCSFVVPLFSFQGALPSRAWNRWPLLPPRAGFCSSVVLLDWTSLCCHRDNHPTNFKPTESGHSSWAQCHWNRFIGPCAQNSSPSPPLRAEWLP